MKSALYLGTVRHRRYQPKPHKFHYSMAYFYLALSEIEKAVDQFTFCSSKRSALLRFRRSDYLGDPAIPLAQAVQEKITALGGDRITGEIYLLTQLRYFGYGFNPVSFYYCYSRDEHLRAILAEVNNTPWGKKHCYLIPVNANEKSQSVQHENQKVFHVSPFMHLDMQYIWRMNYPNEKIIVHIRNLEQQHTLFDASLHLQRKALNQRNVWATIVRFPLLPFKVIAAIYFQALQLWLKKVPFYSYQEVDLEQKQTRSNEIKK